MTHALRVGLVMQGGAGWVGGSEYIKNLALAVAAAARNDGAPVKLTLITGHSLDERTRGELGIEQVVQLPPRRRGMLSRWLRTGDRAFARAVRESGVEFLYPLTYDNEHNVGASFPLRGLDSTRWAGWIPDFQHRMLPHLFNDAEIARRDRGIAALAAQARTIVFSSAAAAADYCRYVPDGAARAEVMRFCTAPRPDWLALDPRVTQQKFNLPERFFLISNQFWQHKNHLLVIEALALLAARGVRPHVVCTGQTSDFRDKTYFQTVLQRLHECGVAAQVALLGLIAREEQIQLMRRCLAVVQPSLCEGWSTVVEDARLLGKAMILSDLDVHREQNPEGATYFERASAASLADALGELWSGGSPGPDAAREAAAMHAATRAQRAFGNRFLEIAHAS